ncbi:MAG TPA: penicillin-binding protein 2 [Candidatus Limnocylindrales bacterium]|nr:penicillin-binding protein 2 [Candidatus Limnocylindrales bacterium]
MLGRTDSRLRLVLLLGAFTVVASLLGLRLAYWQIGQGDELRRIATSQLLVPDGDQDIERGQIVDRHGDVLATTAYRDLLAAYPDLMTADERVRVATRLAEILGLSDAQAASLRDSFQPERQYVVVARRLTERQSEAVRDGLADGELAQLALEPHPVRFYPSAGGSPDTTLASQLLGFVTEDGEGRYGVEQASQDVLAGDLGATASTERSATLPGEGGSVQLTIDASLQLRLEKELYAAWVADRATRVTGLVLDPYTGAVLAWASVPGYDANDYVATAERSPGLFADPIYSQVYEPGSVMKMFTAATALEEGVVTLDTPVVDDRQLRLGGSIVENFDRKGLGVIPFEDAIAHSRNVATGHVALSLGETVAVASERLYDMWQRFGIGRPTGIELPGESAGIVADPADTRWQAIDLVNRSFGQAVAITPLQLATAFAAMVNGGTLPHPHLYQAIDGQPVTAPAGEQVISAELSATLRELLVHVIDEGPHYAAETLIPGYVVGGKTGTAQIWDSRAGMWLDRVYNHTFVGFVGAERPEAIILVRVHDTQPRVHRRWGMTLEMTSNELFRRVALDAIDVLDLPPLPAPSDAPDEPGTAPSMQPAGPDTAATAEPPPIAAGP